MWRDFVVQKIQETEKPSLSTQTRSGLLVKCAYSVPFLYRTYYSFRIIISMGKVQSISNFPEFALLSYVYLHMNLLGVP